VTRCVVLDSGPLGLVTQRRGKSHGADACREWLYSVLAAGARVCVPEIADYELRRELVRAGKADGVARLDSLKRSLTYIPLTTPAMLLAAEYWARTRAAGLPTAAWDALDGDVILAAQVTALAVPDTIVATTNPDHLARFVAAADWTAITP
jgi:hypothetical protein